MGTLFNIGNKIVSSDKNLSGLSFSPSVYIKPPQGQEVIGFNSELKAFFPENYIFDFSRQDVKYVIDSNNVLSEVPADVPSFVYNKDGDFKSLLCESSSTNSIRNSKATGSAEGIIETGYPGAFPTFWRSSIKALDNEIIGTGVERGIEYIDIKFSGVATNQTSDDGDLITHQIAFEDPDFIDANYNATIGDEDENFWTESVYLKIVDSTLPPNSYILYLYEYDSNGDFINGNNIEIEPNEVLERYSLSGKLTNSGVVHIQPMLRFRVIKGNEYNFTIRIGLPQLENRPFASSVIKTENSTVTRARDIITKTNCANEIGQTEGTLYAKVNVINLDGFKFNGYIVQLSHSNNTSGYRVFLSKFSNRFGFGLINNSTGYTLPASPFITEGIHKLAIVYKQGEIISYLNGSKNSIREEDWGNFSSTNLDTINLGASSFNDSEFNQPLEEVAIYKRALSESEAIKLTKL